MNLVTIKYSREARMYPLMLAAILAQVAMFLRALRTGGLANYAAIIVLTALAIASNFAAVLIPVTEGLWLLNVIARPEWRPSKANARRAWTIAIALAAAGLILVPKLFSSLHAASSGHVGGWRNCIPVCSLRAIQQGNRQLCIPGPRGACTVGRGQWMATRCARRGRLRNSLDVGAAAHDARRVVRNCAGVRRALRAVEPFRSSSSSRWAYSSCPAISCASQHSRSQWRSRLAISFRTIASRTTRNIAKQLPPPIPRSSRVKS